MNHNCGIFGIIDKSTNDYLIKGTELLQHRGHDSAGICYINDDKFIREAGIGMVADIFKDTIIPETAPMGISHVRYSTLSNKEDVLLCTQPFVDNSDLGEFAFAHNGNIPEKTLHDIKKNYNLGDSCSDSLILSKLIKLFCSTCPSWDDVMIKFMNSVMGAYCVCIMTKDKIYAARDRYGFRPLVIGINISGIMIASESTAFDFSGDEIIKDVNPGEIVVLNSDKTYRSIYKFKNENTSMCCFEHIYFFRHTSIHNGESVYDTRYKMGLELGKLENNILKDSIVSCIPATSIPAAYGFATAINRPYKDYITKNHNGYVNRTFILPTNELRMKACLKKFCFNPDIEGKDIYLLDDSIVRGNTMTTVIKILRKYNAKSIHVRITAPPIISQCHYGIDISSKNELIAHKRTIDMIAEELGVDSLKYIDMEPFTSVFNEKICTSCLTGKYNKDLEW